jgi:hypothetical protein
MRIMYWHFAGPAWEPPTLTFPRTRGRESQPAAVWGLNSSTIHLSPAGPSSGGRASWRAASGSDKSARLEPRPPLK